MKIILILLDGAGDRSYDFFGHKTPLQAAWTPNLDKLAAMGSNGLYHPAAVGQCLPSEIAHHLLFGYGLQSFPGRGLLEARGCGAPCADEDVLAMAHLSTVRWEGNRAILLHGPELFHQATGDMDSLYGQLQALTPFTEQGITISLHRKPGRNDALLILQGGASPQVSDSDPIIPGRPIAKVVALQGSSAPDAAARTAACLNGFLAKCAAVLKSHPVNARRYESGMPAANFLVTQRCGRRIPQQPFRERYGMRGLIMAAGGIYRGLAAELGMDFVPRSEKGDPGCDLRESIRLALDDPGHEFVHVHTKLPDVAAHSGDPGRKRDVLASLDCGLDIVVESLAWRQDLLVAVTADHSTPSISELLIHSGEQVPLAIAGHRVRRDEVASFDEISAARGCLGTLRGPELMFMLLNYADRANFFGHQLGGRASCCVPDDYEPFLSTF
jgi:2,3-bisphosphoglycerate-independent phosphoglycerate mutase